MRRGRSSCWEPRFARSLRMTERPVAGVVAAQLPSGLYQVELEGARRITAHLGSGLDRNFVRVLIGDHVEVELTPRDLTRGRIVRKTR